MSKLPYRVDEHLIYILEDVDHDRGMTSTADSREHRSARDEDGAQDPSSTRTVR